MRKQNGMLRLGKRILHAFPLLLPLWRKKEYRGRNQSKHDEANQNKRNKNNKPVSNIIVHHDLGAEELPGRPKTQVVHVEAGCEIFLDYVATIPFRKQEVESTVQKEIPWPTHRACSGDHPGSVAHADVRLRRGGAIVNYVKDTCTLSRTRDLPVPTQYIWPQIYTDFINAQYSIIKWCIKVNLIKRN